jgi:methionyl-tRNA formyltransferase
MRIVYFANNKVGLESLKYLRSRNDADIVGLVLHPNDRARFRDELISESGLPADKVFDGSNLRSPEIIDQIRKLEPDLGLSVFFGYILRRPLIGLFPSGCLNLHPAYLPFNRGAHPNVWSIVDGTPAGVTLHYIDEGIDTGDIVMQRRVETFPHDTGETLYRRLETACVDLMRSTWPLVEAGTADAVPQDPDEGTYHSSSDLAALDRIVLDEAYTASHIINIIRARTFPPYSGTYFEHEGMRVYLCLEMSPDGDADQKED